MAGGWVIGKWDKPLAIEFRGCVWIFAAAALEGWIISGLAGGDCGCGKVLLSVMGGCLLLACVTDILFCQVYNFIWWPGLAAALAVTGRRCSLLCAAREGLPGICTAFMDVFGSLLIFWMVQTFVFRRMYGRADYYAFCVCAAAETAEGMGLAGFLGHMLLAYALLLPVQAVRRNIDRKGNLKQPVPFLPYITASFWMMLVLSEGCIFHWQGV